MKSFVYNLLVKLWHSFGLWLERHKHWDDTW